MREHTLHSPSPPAEMLAALSGHLRIPGGNGRFIAMSLAVHDPDRRKLHRASPTCRECRDGRTIIFPSVRF